MALGRCSKCVLIPPNSSYDCQVIEMLYIVVTATTALLDRAIHLLQYTYLVHCPRVLDQESAL